MSRRKIGAAAVLLAALALWLFALAPRPRTIDRDALELGAAAEPTPAPAPAPQLKTVTARAPSANRDQPIIDRVLIEKEEVCEGEENLITVHAHMPDPADDGFLRYMVSSTMGREVPLRSLAPQPDDLPRLVLVHGKNGQTAQVEVPKYRIKPCREAHALFIESGLVPNTLDEYQLWVTLRTIDAKSPFAPVRYEWKFDDGSAQTTTVPRTTHRFVAQNRMYANHLVRCTAIDARGARVSGRMALELANPAYQALAYKQVVLLSIAGSPRFASMNDAGEVEQRIRVWHQHPHPIELHDAVLTYVHQDGTREDGGELDPRAVLGTHEISPEGIETELRWNAPPKVVMLNYQFTGRSQDGLRVTGQFSLMKPAPEPTRESAPVTDPALAAKIMRAQEYLERDTVSDYDLWRLEQDGVFADLKLDPSAAPEPRPDPLPERRRKRVAP